jgi:hypothetical protein
MFFSYFTELSYNPTILKILVKQHFPAQRALIIQLALVPGAKEFLVY